MSEYEETDSLTLAVARALAESFKATIAGSAGAEFESTGVTLPKMAVWERYAEAAIGAFYDFHSKPMEGDVFEETEEDSRKRRGLDDAYDAGRADGAEEALRAAMIRRDFP